MASTICLFDVIPSITSIICLFELVHLNDLLFDEWLDHDIKEVNNKEALKSSIFVVQMAAAPKNGVEFCQGSIGTGVGGDPPPGPSVGRENFGLSPKLKSNILGLAFESKR